MSFPRVGTRLVAPVLNWVRHATTLSASTTATKLPLATHFQKSYRQSPIFRGFTPSSLRNQVVPPQQQGEQSRTIYTTASTDVERMKMSDLPRLFETRGLKELLRGATFMGLHGTSAANVQGIKESGIDFGRTGANFHGFSAAGSGLYVIKSPIAVIYAVTAAKKDGAAKTDSAEKKLQLLAVFRLPSSNGEVKRQHLRDPNRKDDADEIVMSRDGTDHIIKITPFGINSENIEYVGVPLPPFSESELDEAAKQLKEFFPEIANAGQE